MAAKVLKCILLLFIYITIFDTQYLSPSAQLLSAKMNQESDLYLPSALMKAIKQSLQEVLDIPRDESMYCNKSAEEIAKIIEKNPSPHKDCIKLNRSAEAIVCL